MSTSGQNQLTQAGNVITLTVKVSELFNADYPPSNDCAVNDYTKLSQNGNSSGYGQPKNDFVTNVKLNGAIFWNIRFEDNTERRDFSLGLICISEKKASPCNFFDFDPLLPVRNFILATPRHGYPDNIYSYNIIFNITDNYKNSQTYVIDPQLRMT